MTRVGRTQSHRCIFYFKIRSYLNCQLNRFEKTERFIYSIQKSSISGMYNPKILHHRDRNPTTYVPITSPDNGGVFGGRGADTAACKTKRRQKPTVNDNDTNQCRLGRRPGEQDPRPLPSK